MIANSYEPMCLRIPCWAMATLGVFSFLLASADADSVYRSRSGRGTSRVSGTVTETTPFEVTLQTPNGPQKIPASEVRRIAVDDQPVELGRARERFDDGRFAECLQELQKIDQRPKSEWAQQELDFLKAAANANIALSGGTVTAQSAGQDINTFLVTYPNSNLTFPATELFGKLLFAFGRLDNAAEAFEKLTKSRWPQYEFLGHFQLGQTRLAQDQPDVAADSFRAVMELDSDDPDSETWKQLAQCQLARCEGVAGQADSALKSLAETIKTGNAENDRLFSCAFNAMGAIYLKQGEIKQARNEFLKTQLLYASAKDQHAEALYHLTQIWTQLNEPERANQARSTLASRHRNSWWASR